MCIRDRVATLRQAGFSDPDAANAAYLLSNFVPGFVAEETMVRPSALDRPQIPAATPVPSVDHARLEIGWARRLTVKAEPTLPELYHVESEGHPPEITAANGVVKLLHTRGRKPSTLLLNATIPWEVSVRGGAAQLTADLRGLQLTALEVQGGASALDLTLPTAIGTVPIQLTGGTSKLNIHRPPDVPLRLDVRGGISHLTFDHRPFKSAGELTVQSPGYDGAADRYDVRLTGGASRIVVDALMPAESEGGADARVPERADEKFAGLPAADYPNLVALSAPLIQQSMDDRFRFGVRVLLDGLEQRLRAESGTMPS